MQLSELDKQVVANMHDLSFSEQQSIFEYSRLLKSKKEKKPLFATRLKEFLKEVEDDPIDIDTSIFDDYRKNVTERFNAPQKKLLKRQAGLGRGTVWMSDDFDEELPDSFWLGEDE